MNNGPKHTVFYDGDCGFCEWSVALLQRLDWLDRFRYATLQSPEAREAGIAFELSPSEIVLRVPLPDKTLNGRMWGGWRAVKRISFLLPALYIGLAVSLFVHPWLTVALLLGLTPLGNPLGDWLYRLIARNRHRFPASTCSLENR